jgi:hypothetical protein
MFIEVTPFGRFLFKALRVVVQAVLILVPVALVIVFLVSAVKCTANLARSIGSSLASSHSSGSPPKPRSVQPQIPQPVALTQSEKRFPPTPSVDAVPRATASSSSAAAPPPILAEAPVVAEPVYVVESATVYTREFVKRQDGRRPAATTRPASRQGTKPLTSSANPPPRPSASPSNPRPAAAARPRPRAGERPWAQRPPTLMPRPSPQPVQGARQQHR